MRDQIAHKPGVFRSEGDGFADRAQRGFPSIVHRAEAAANDILEDRLRDQLTILIHHAELAADGRYIETGQILAIHVDRPRRGRLEL